MPTKGIAAPVGRARDAAARCSLGAQGNSALAACLSVIQATQQQQHVRSYLAGIVGASCLRGR